MQASQFSIFLAAAFVALFSLQISAAVLPRQLIPAAPARGKAASTSLQAVTDGSVTTYPLPLFFHSFITFVNLDSHPI
jgi:hypothetical protein